MRMFAVHDFFLVDMRYSFWDFFDEVLGGNWRRTELVIKFCVSRVKIELYPKKSRRTERFAVAVQAFQVRSEGILPFVDAKDGLKTLWSFGGIRRRLLCGRAGRQCSQQPGKHRIIVAPLKGILPYSDNFLQLAGRFVRKQV